MPSIGPRCHELPVRDEKKNWRIIYRIDQDVILIGAVFEKKTKNTRGQVINACKRRFRLYDDTVAASASEE
jgi:phage-related protein